MESLISWFINLNFEKLTLMTGFVVQGHRTEKASVKENKKWIKNKDGRDVFQPVLGVM